MKVQPTKKQLEDAAIDTVNFYLNGGMKSTTPYTNTLTIKEILAALSYSCIAEQVADQIKFLNENTKI
jgi:hypothetical protein